MTAYNSSIPICSLLYTTYVIPNVLRLVVTIGNSVTQLSYFFLINNSIKKISEIYLLALSDIPNLKNI